MTNIKFWQHRGSISEAEAEQLRSAVGTLRGAISADVSSPNLPPTAAAERKFNQLPSLKGAKVVPHSFDSEGRAEQNLDQPLPPIGATVAAPRAGREVLGRVLSRAETLGVPAAAVNRRRDEGANTALIRWCSRRSWRW